jgi:hypothetical protein
MFRHTALVSCVVLGSTWKSAAVLVAQEAPAKRAISVDEIGRSVELIGRLGKPLGTKMEIRGRWLLPTDDMAGAKDSAPRLTVTEVDGKALARPVEFHIAQVRAMTAEHADALPTYEQRERLGGQEWSMIAYEKGYLAVGPDEYLDKRRVFPAVAEPYYHGTPFVSQLVAVVAATAD